MDNACMLSGSRNGKMVPSGEGLGEAGRPGQCANAIHTQGSAAPERRPGSGE